MIGGRKPRFTVFYFGQCQTLAEVKVKYRELIKKYHPDKAAQNGVDREEAEKITKDVNAQYQALTAHFAAEIGAHHAYERAAAQRRARQQESDKRAADGYKQASEKDTTHKDFAEEDEGPSKGHWTGYSAGSDFGRKGKTQAQAEAARNKQDAKENPEAAQRVAEAYVLVKSFPGVELELIGLWLWCKFKEKPDAETRQKLKDGGFRWSAQREKWYFAGVKSGTRRGKKASDDELRSKYGSARL